MLNYRLTFLAFSLRFAPYSTHDILSLENFRAELAGLLRKMPVVHNDVVLSLATGAQVIVSQVK